MSQQQVLQQQLQDQHASTTTNTLPSATTLKQLLEAPVSFSAATVSFSAATGLPSYALASGAQKRLHGLAGLPAMASQLPNPLLSVGPSNSQRSQQQQLLQNQSPFLIGNAGGKPASMASLQAASAAAFPPLTMAGTNWNPADQFETAASAFLGPLNMWDRSTTSQNLLGGLSGANPFDLHMSNSSSLAAALAASAGNVNTGGTSGGGGGGSASGGSGNGDFKLEYMDLDEFLCENGLASSGGAASSALLGGGSNSNGSGGGSSSAAAAVAAAASNLLNAVGSQQSAVAANSQALMLERHLHNAVMQAAAANGTNASGGNSTSSPTAGPGLGIGEENKVSSTTGMKENDSPPNQHIDMRVEFDISPADLHLASVPGEAPFDPRRRRFSEEELKPQPMIKKSKKTFVPHESKDDKYWARRRKNNIAAKKSRDARRIKENQVSIRASYLEKENTKLRDQLERLIRDNLTMRERCRCGAAMSVKFDPNDFEIVAKRLHTPTSSPSATMSSGASTSGDRA